MEKSKIIKLTKGKSTIVDEEDYESLIKYKWFSCYATKYCYAHTRKFKEQKQTKMHRLIMNAPDGIEVDHINGDTLDNRKYNLRLCTHAENIRNSNRKTGVSGFRGVRLDKRNKFRPWYSVIRFNFKIIFLGYFKTAKKSALAYNEAAKKYHGEFAKLNEI